MFKFASNPINTIILNIIQHFIFHSIPKPYRCAEIKSINTIISHLTITVVQYKHKFLENGMKRLNKLIPHHSLEKVVG